MVAVVATKTLCFVLSLSINLFYKKSHVFSLLLTGQDQRSVSVSMLQMLQMFIFRGPNSPFSRF